MCQPQEESHLLAARLAAASEVFPITKADDWDSTARVSAEGDVITVVVREHMGRATRVYRAVLQPVSPDHTEMLTAPSFPVLTHRAGAVKPAPTTCR